MSILVTGAAGFIGFHLANRLCKEGYRVVGLDNLSPYYDVNLKKSRLQVLSEHENFSFEESGLENKERLFELFETNKFEYVVNLAAQAGVRHSLTKPHDYIHANIEGVLNILEACRAYPVKHLVYAASSSVYGANTEMPFTETEKADTQLTIYAATKKANELLSQSYARHNGLPQVGLRF